MLNNIFAPPSVFSDSAKGLQKSCLKSFEAKKLQMQRSHYGIRSSDGSKQEINEI